MKYSVNKIEIKESSWTKDFIGLFRGVPECTGEGSFCGYYAIEYFNRAFLLAQYSRESENQGAKVYNSKGQPHTEESIIKKYVKKYQLVLECGLKHLKQKMMKMQFVSFLQKNIKKRNKIRAI